MTLQQWTAQILLELQAAGFKAREHQGFPLMQMPDGHLEIVRLLKFRTSLGSDRRIYAEGMLFLPAGSWKLAEVSDGDTRATHGS